MTNVLDDFNFRGGKKRKRLFKKKMILFDFSVLHVQFVVSQLSKHIFKIYIESNKVKLSLFFLSLRINYYHFERYLSVDI